MKAVGFYQSLPITDLNSLVDIEVPVIDPGANDILVEVKAISVNPVDYKVRMSSLKEKHTTPKILGYDAAGVVVKVGSTSSLFKPGDKVYYAGDVTRNGTNSELHLVDERIVGHMPATLSFGDSASLPLTALTAWESLFERLAISQDPESNKNKTILIIGGAGGVGSIAIQLAKQVAGLNIIATASKEDSANWCRNLGADHIVNHYHDIVKQVKDLGYNFVDYIFILNSTDKHFISCAELIKPQGTICTIVETKDGLDVTPLKTKSAGLHWEFMFTRSMYKTPDMIEQHNILNKIARLIDDGIIHSSKQQVLSPINAENLRLAHQKLESGATIGKIVLEGF